MIIAAATGAWQGCGGEGDATPVDCAGNPVVLHVVSVGDANCSSNDGSIEVNATGGSGNYKYSLGSGAEQTSAVFTNMGAGTYEVSAVDDNDCTATIAVSVKNVHGMNITYDTSPSGCKLADGVVTVHATDGTEPYQFKLDNGSAGTTNTFTKLSSGDHTLVVTDAGGCTITQHVAIASGISYSGNISSIIAKNCAVSGCHNGSQSPDFRSFKNIHDNAGQIKTLTGNRTMPREGSLTQAEIDMIACWVDDGALEN